MANFELHVDGERNLSEREENCQTIKAEHSSKEEGEKIS
jgi:hypothetical protein